MAISGLHHGDAHQQCNTVGAVPVSQDGKADGTVVVMGDEMRGSWVGHSGAVLGFVRATDEGFVAGQPFGLHDEREVGFGGFGYCCHVDDRDRDRS